MKSQAEPRTANNAKRQSPFFNRGNGGHFFGNQNHSFFNSPPVQAKLTVNEPGDVYEKEADSMADKVVQRLARPESISENTSENLIQAKFSVYNSTGTNSIVQSKCAGCEKEDELQKKEIDDTSEKELQTKPIFESASDKDDEKKIQRKCAKCEAEEKVQRKSDPAASAVSPRVESTLKTSKGSGSPLPPGAKHQMETSFGADFSNVRIHNDSNARQLNKDLSAHAFTHGSDIYFSSGKFQPGTSSGQHLLAHELTHVLQQSGSTFSQGEFPHLSRVYRRFSALQSGVDTVQMKVDLLNITSSPLSIQRDGLLDLTGIGKYLNIQLPDNPIDAIEAILNALDNPYVRPVLAVMPGFAQTVMVLRMALGILKFINYVIEHKEQIIAEIKKYIEDKLDQVEPLVKAKLEEALGFIDDRHYKAIWSTYMKPMLIHLKDHWWETIKETLWEQIWPFEGITTVTEAKAEDRKGLGKDLFEIKENVVHAFTELKDLHFSKFVDNVLLLNKGLVGIVNRFYGWVAIIIIASETLAGAGIAGFFSGGTLSGPGAAAGFGAGLATVGEIGEALLIATIAADAAVLVKSIFSLHPVDSALVDEQKMIDNTGYYKQIAQSTISLTIMLLFLVLAYLGAKIAEAFLGRLVKYLPKGIQEILENIKLGMKGEKPGEPLEVRENPPELEPELAKVKEKANAKENIEQVTDPELMKDYDAEIKIGDHVYRRNKAKGTWCRFSDPVCGVKLEDINVKADEVVKPPEAPKELQVGEQVTVPYGDGRPVRAKIVEIKDGYVKFEYITKTGTKNVALSRQVKLETFNQWLKDGSAIRWTESRELLMKNRPDYDAGLVDKVWEDAKSPDGKVRDPNPPYEELSWDKAKSRYDQWHMGHKPGKEYVKLVDEYVNGKITYEEFLKEYNNPANYRPEHPTKNVSHQFEQK